MIDWGVKLPLVYMCIVLYVKLIWYNGLACTYDQLRGVICLWYICVLSYVSNLCGLMIFSEIYVRSAMRCAKCGVAVLQASMLNGGLICHGYMCIVLYKKLIWCNGFAETYP